MGLVFGKISVETPKYNVLDKGEDYEIREYESNIIAQVTYDPAHMKRGRDGGFMVLADYIGALGKPNNVRTARVTTQESTEKNEAEKIAMTSPVLTQQQNNMVTMQFVLPSKYSMENVPRPTDPRVVVKEIPSRKYGVITFSGTADDILVEKMLQRLKNALEGAGYKIAGEHSLGRYNPPWTLPFLRTNDVMVPIE